MAAIATFALNEASNLRCLPIILKILLAKVLLFFAFARLSDFSVGLFFLFIGSELLGVDELLMCKECAEGDDE